MDNSAKGIFLISSSKLGNQNDVLPAKVPDLRRNQWKRKSQQVLMALERYKVCCGRMSGIGIPK